MHPISQLDIETLFTEAHTHKVWLDKKVDEALIVRAYDLAKMCPTSFNASPMRILFVRSKEAKELLVPCLNKANVEQVMTAPVTAIIAMDLEFYTHIPKLYPHNPEAGKIFEGNPDAARTNALRNSSLQGAYFLLALRAVGLDTGAISGFSNAKVDEEFFAGTSYRSNFIINIGYGDVAKLHPRNPRFEFKEACKIV